MSRQAQYNAERAIQNDWAKRDFNAERMIEDTYKASYDRISSKIDQFYLKYANENGLTRAEAMKQIKGFDVQAWSRKAAKAVKEKDFSPETNAWLKTFNAKQRISRLELLKAELELEIAKLHAEKHEIFNQHLWDETKAELERQAGILKGSTDGSSRRVRQIVNADFYGTVFSAKVWGAQADMRKELFVSLNRIFTDMAGYRQERNRLAKKFNTSQANALRLLKTESGRVRMAAQLESYKQNEFTHYHYVSEPGACELCGRLDGQTFKVEEAEPGVNFPLMHPNCRCSTYGEIEMIRK